MTQRYWISRHSLRESFRQLVMPDEHHPSVESINMRNLYQKGYRTVFLDLDNTILPYGKYTVSLQKTAWVQTVISIGFSVVIISNNRSHNRVNMACEQLGVHGAHFVCKPFISGFQAFLAHTGTYYVAEQGIVIGDQLLTDGIFAKRIGAYSILVDPINPGVSIRKIIQRELELGLMTLLK